MWRYIMHFLKKMGLMLLVASCFITAASAGEVELLNIGKSKTAAFCRKWENKEWNAVSTKKTTSDAENFTFNGIGRCTVSLIITQKLADGVKRELRYVIASDGDSEPEVLVALSYSNDKHATLQSKFTLKKGEHEYIFKPNSFKRGNYSFDFVNLKTVAFTLHAEKIGKGTFSLRRVYVKEGDQRKGTVTALKKTGERKCAEIFPAGTSENIFFKSGSTTLSGNWDAETLRLCAKTDFGTTGPKTEVRDVSRNINIWHDDATELFFSGTNDNNRYIQYVFNSAGIEWSSVRIYDVIAACVVTKTNSVFEHKLKPVVENGIATYNIEIPLKSIEKGKQKFIGFQFCQHVGKEVRVFNPTKRFVPPANYGILVFNKKPFGPGSAKLTECKRTDFAGQDASTFEFTCKSNGIPEGSRAIMHLTFPDNTIHSEPVTLSDKIILSGMKNLPGTYCAYLEILNTAGNSLVTATNFQNLKEIPDRSGEIIIFPAPKKIVCGEGSFSLANNPVISLPEKATDRTKLTAKVIAERLKRITGLDFRIVEGGKKGIMLRIVPGGHEQGYTLKVTPLECRIDGNDEPGLYYGCVSLVQSLLSARKQTVSIPVISVEDWPDMKKRCIAFYRAGVLGKGAKPAEDRGIDALLNWLEKYVADSKQNWAVMDLSCSAQIKSRPDLIRQYTNEDLIKLGNWCRERFIEPIPRFQLGSHNTWNPEVNEKLKKMGFKYTEDKVSTPLYDTTVFPPIMDHVRALKAKYVHIGGDEWWLNQNISYELNGVPRYKIVADFWNRCAAFFKANGIRPIIHGDELTNTHNGRYFDGSRITETLSRDFIIEVWCYPESVCRELAGKGFEIAAILTSTTLVPESELKFINGFGYNIYHFNIYRFLDGKPYPVAHSYFMQNMYAADFAWNAFRKEHKTLMEFVYNGYAMAAHRMENVQHASGKLKKIACSPQKLQIPVNGKYGKFVFAQTVDYPDEILKKYPFNAMNRQWFYGAPVGDWNIVYDDGTMEKIPVRFTDNVIPAENKFFLLALNSVGEIIDGERRYNVSEWLNPHPEKTIRELKFDTSLAKKLKIQEMTLDLKSLSGTVLE